MNKEESENTNNPNFDCFPSVIRNLFETMFNNNSKKPTEEGCPKTRKKLNRNAFSDEADKPDSTNTYVDYRPDNSTEEYKEWFKKEFPSSYNKLMDDRIKKIKQVDSKKEPTNKNKIEEDSPNDFEKNLITTITIDSCGKYVGNVKVKLREINDTTKIVTVSTASDDGNSAGAVITSKSFYSEYPLNKIYFEIDKGVYDEKNDHTQHVVYIYHFDDDDDISPDEEPKTECTNKCSKNKNTIPKIVHPVIVDFEFNGYSDDVQIEFVENFPETFINAKITTLSGTNVHTESISKAFHIDCPFYQLNYNILEKTYDNNTNKLRVTVIIKKSNKEKSCNYPYEYNKTYEKFIHDIRTYDHLVVFDLCTEDVFKVMFRDNEYYMKFPDCPEEKLCLDSLKRRFEYRECYYIAPNRKPVTTN